MAKNINTLRDLTDRLKNRAQGLDDLVDRLQDSTPLDAVVVAKTLTATTEYISHLVALILCELPPLCSSKNCREFFAVNEPIPEITDEEAGKPVSSLTKRYPTKVVDGDVQVLTLDGENWIDARAYQQSLNSWPTPVAKFISTDGEPTLTNLTTAHEKCGCEIVGCGTLQFPLVIQYCEAHAKTEVA